MVKYLHKKAPYISKMHGMLIARKTVRRKINFSQYFMLPTFVFNGIIVASHSCTVYHY